MRPHPVRQDTAVGRAWTSTDRPDRQHGRRGRQWVARSRSPPLVSPTAARRASPAGWRRRPVVPRSLSRRRRRCLAVTVAPAGVLGDGAHRRRRRLRGGVAGTRDRRRGRRAARRRDRSGRRRPGSPRSGARCGSTTTVLAAQLPQADAAIGGRRGRAADRSVGFQPRNRAFRAAARSPRRPSSSASRPRARPKPASCPRARAARRPPPGWRRHSCSRPPMASSFAAPCSWAPSRPKGQEMFRLVRDGRLELDAKVPELDLAAVHPGQAVQRGRMATGEGRGDRARRRADRRDRHAPRRSSISRCRRIPPASRHVRARRNPCSTPRRMLVAAAGGDRVSRRSPRRLRRGTDDDRVSLRRLTTGMRRDGFVEILSGPAGRGAGRHLRRRLPVRRRPRAGCRAARRSAAH